MVSKSATMKVTQKPISWLKPYEKNVKKHSQDDVEKLAGIIQEFGWQQPVVATEDGEIVIGHRRYLAAKHLEMGKVPVHVAAGLSDEQVRALRLADNRLADDTPVDNALVALELKELQAAGYDLELTAFNARELKSLGSTGKTTWLDKDVAGSDEDPKAASRTASDLKDYVQLTFVMGPKERDMIVKKLKAKATEWGLPTAGAALIKLCEDLK